MDFGISSDVGGFAPWDIVRVDFPFADVAQTKRRPALVIATTAVADAFSLAWVLMITSAAHEACPLDVPITDFRLGGLSHACVVRTSKVTSLDSRLAVRIGELAKVDRVKVAAGLHSILDAVLAL